MSMPAVMTDAISSAQSGIQAGEAMLDATSGRIAEDTAAPSVQQAGTGAASIPAQAASFDRIDSDIPDLMLSKFMVAANVMSMNAAQEAYRSVLRLGSSH